MKRYTKIPNDRGECPICNGTGLIPIPDNLKQYSWWADKEDMECNNCGGQTMMGKALGYVGLREDGSPCVHNFRGVNIGRCLTEYFCEHCSDRFVIDSGD